MVNLYEKILETDVFPKVSYSELLFSEYTCLQEETKFGIWSNCNYFAFVTSGRKTWKTIQNDYEANDGDILFIKKGANLTHQFFEDEFCAIFLFIPDDFIKNFLKTYASHLNISDEDIADQDAVLRVRTNDLLSNYGKSIKGFFSLKEKPNEHLVRLKFEELLLSLFDDKNNNALTSYFVSLCRDSTIQLARVMEKNFAYNLKLEDYAKLCGMSLSSFKSAFKKHYNATPAAWLKARKIDLARNRLFVTDLPINQIAFECGFEDPSHFNRVFKQKLGVTPLQYRQQEAKKSS